MNALRIRSGERSWRFNPLPAAPETDLLRVMARASLVDDVTLAPPQVPLTVRAAAGPWTGRAGPDGLVGLIGRPSQGGPIAALAGLQMDMEITAQGYADLALGGVLPAQPAGDFVPLEFGARRLQRLALVIEGRVLRRIAGNLQPVAGAVVTIIAATPVPALAGALPAPVAVAALVGTVANTNAAGLYRFAAIPRFASVTLRVTAPAQGNPVTVVPVLPHDRINQDFHLP